MGGETAAPTATARSTKPGAARTTTARWPRRAEATVLGDFADARSSPTPA
ncbi:MAG: hypothetical protein MZW92_10770 [Comamonadaceae bacterium]|nr:hypothetical protein [Comamonadaceae bacterium]